MELVTLGHSTLALLIPNKSFWKQLWVLFLSHVQVFQLEFFYVQEYMFGKNGFDSHTDYW
jgi:hypothetical protein